ncbi:MAG TPA: hypothetical protein PK024_13410, partial [Methanospirillum sp.]|uniref:glycosyltransferase family 4 protein n=1 Tax=Methanospirillum sp. TaxID=45200 RepID=UPI002CC0E97A
MNILILDVHHPEDGRVNRHKKYMQSLGYKVIHINVNRYFPFLKSGSFSKYGESGYRISVGDYSHSLKNRIFLQIYLLLPLLAFKIYKYIKHFQHDPVQNLIIHIHDYELLPTGVFLHFFFHSKKTKIVYDRHELFETPKADQRISDKIPQIYEYLYSRWIDGIVGVSEDHIFLLRKQFSNSEIIIVPNFFDGPAYPINELEYKISSLNKNYIKKQRKESRCPMTAALSSC